MNKITIIFFVFFIVLVALIYYLSLDKQVGENSSSNNTVLGPIDTSKITDEQIADLLKTNPDSLGYINRYKDFVIKDKTPLTKESISAGQQGENFKEVYQGLEMEDSRYLRVDLINKDGSYGMITVLDLKTASVLKAFGLLLMQAGVQTK